MSGEWIVKGMNGAIIDVRSALESKRPEMSRLTSLTLSLFLCKMRIRKPTSEASES